MKKYYVYGANIQHNTLPTIILKFLFNKFMMFMYKTLVFKDKTINMINMERGVK